MEGGGLSSSSTKQPPDLTLSVTSPPALLPPAGHRPQEIVSPVNVYKVSISKAQRSVVLPPQYHLHLSSRRHRAREPLIIENGRVIVSTQKKKHGHPYSLAVAPLSTVCSIPVESVECYIHWRISVKASAFSVITRLS